MQKSYTYYTEKALYFFMWLVYFTTPLESIKFGGGNSSIVRISVFGFILCALLNKVWLRLRWNVFLTPFLLYGAWCIASSLWSIDPDESFSRSIIFMPPTFLLTLTLINSIDNKKQLNYCAWGYICGCLLLSVLSLGHREIMQSDINGEMRVTTAGHDPNEMGALLNIGMAFLFIVLQDVKSRWVLWAGRGTALLLMFVLLSTGSRTAFVTLTFLMAVYGSREIRKGHATLMISALIAFLAILFILIPEGTLFRLFETKEQVGAADLTGRGYIWKTALNAFPSEAIVTGLGFSSFQAYFTTLVNFPIAPHNSYLSCFMGTGIIGLVLYVSMICIILYYCFRIARREKSLLIFALMLPFLLGSMVLGLELRRWLYLLAAFIIRYAQLGADMELSTAKLKLLYLLNMIKRQKMKQKNQLLSLLLLCLLLCSCNSQKEVVYFQDLAERTPRLLEEQYQIRLQPNDQLRIMVFGPDKYLIMPYNQTLASVAESGLGGGGSRENQQPYEVNENGYIKFPVLGEIKVEGLTLTELKNKLYEILSQEIKDVTLTVELINFRVTVLGEVNKPGTFNVLTKRYSFLQALGEAGDMKLTADREHVILIRNKEGKEVHQQIDMRTSNLLDSEYFYLQQNDIIYIPPISGRSAEARRSDTLWQRLTYSVIALCSVITTIYLIK